jgi:hypothetical protein
MCGVTTLRADDGSLLCYSVVICPAQSRRATISGRLPMRYSRYPAATSNAKRIASAW